MRVLFASHARGELKSSSLTEQDDALDDLSRAVTRTKHIAVAVHDELDLQEHLLVRRWAFTSFSLTQGTEARCRAGRGDG